MGLRGVWFWCGSLHRLMGCVHPGILRFAFRFGFGQFAGHLFKFFHAGQVVHIFKAEAEQEFLGGLVEDGPADDWFSAGGSDEFAADQAAEDAAGVDSADLADLGCGDGLLVGNDGQGFQGLQRELHAAA